MIPKVGQAVFCDGSSALIGDVVSVDAANGVAEIAWRATTTMEQFDDLKPATTFGVGDSCNGCDVVGEELNEDGYCATCEREQRENPA
jgi:hypothetical protein